MERELARLFAIQRSGGDRRRFAHGAGSGSGRVVALRRMRRGIAGLWPMDRASPMAIATELSQRAATAFGRRGKGRGKNAERLPGKDRSDARARLQARRERFATL